MSSVKRVASNKPLRIAEIVNQVHGDEHVIVWTEYDEEGEVLCELIPDAVHITGKMKLEDRAEILDDFRSGKIRVIVTKPRLMGTGLNLQHCRVCVFSWAKDSFEEFYQAIGRVLRYGQKRRVKVYIPHTDLEAPMLSNVMAKRDVFLEDSGYQEKLYVECLLDELREFVAGSITQASTEETWLPPVMERNYTLIHGDCIRVMASMPEDQFDMAVFSPPFADLYSYTDKHEDIGNCNSLDDEFELHFMFFAHHLFRVMKPGCIVAMHIAPLATFKSIQGYMGIRDLPAECRQIFENVGFIYDGKATIGKNPQAQAIRTKSHGLLFKTLKRDSRVSRFAIPDYLMKFRKPGEAPPLKNVDVTNEEWIRMASPIWDWVDETNTLNARTKCNGDTKHICPLQLDVIDAAIRLWSGRGEHVLSPFMGIGSEGVVAVKLERRFTGIELKQEYFETAAENIRNAATKRQLTIWEKGLAHDQTARHVAAR